MKTLRRLFKQFFSWRTARQAEEILQSEIEEHIAIQTAENLRAGMEPTEARRQALLKFGNVEAIKELYRDQRGLPFMETFLSDARPVLRRLREKGSSIYSCGYPDAGARHRREYSHLWFSRQHNIDPPAAVSTRGSSGWSLANCARTTRAAR